jgi:hypothetical protein
MSRSALQDDPNRDLLCPGRKGEIEESILRLD